MVRVGVSLGFGLAFKCKVLLLAHPCGTRNYSVTVSVKKNSGMKFGCAQKGVRACVCRVSVDATAPVVFDKFVLQYCEYLNRLKRMFGVCTFRVFCYVYGH